MTSDKLTSGVDTSKSSTTLKLKEEEMKRRVKDDSTHL